MSSRSKVLLVILIVVVVVIFSSFFEEKPATDEKLTEWEEEIANPNNELDPLNEKVGNNIFIIDLAHKIETGINKIFSLVISLFEGVIEKVFVVFL